MHHDPRTLSLGRSATECEHHAESAEAADDLPLAIAWWRAAQLATSDPRRQSMYRELERAVHVLLRKRQKEVRHEVDPVE